MVTHSAKLVAPAGAGGVFARCGTPRMLSYEAVYVLGGVVDNEIQVREAQQAGQ